MIDMVHTHTYGVLMAGGVGSRFWPMSRREQPKQFLDILDEGRTMIRSTAFRLEAVAPASHFYVVTGQLYQDEVLRQLPYLHPSQVLTEPVGRNTAPCIAYAAYRIYAEDPEAIMVVCPSDHHIDDAVSYQRVLHQAITYVAEHDVLMTIGIEPTYPATGYGYIELAGESDQEGVYRVARFKEKPDLEEAERLLARGNHLWNAGIFVWKAIDIINALEKYLPDVAVHFAEIETYGEPGEAEDAADAYRSCPSISIDYGVLERADNVVVLPGSFGWDDIGTWSGLERYMSEHRGERSEPQTLFLDESEGTFVRETTPRKRVVVNGLEDFLIVDTPDLLFIAPKGDEARLTELLRKYPKETGVE